MTAAVLGQCPQGVVDASSADRSADVRPASAADKRRAFDPADFPSRFDQIVRAVPV
jgi:hypothetical protein